MKFAHNAQTIRHILFPAKRYHKYIAEKDLMDHNAHIGVTDGGKRYLREDSVRVDR